MQETIIQPEAWKETIARVRGQIGEVIVGQQEVVEQMLWCIFAGGHALLEGIPGLGKTMLVRTIADTLELSFSRIQFTPDLMPSDITGTQILSFGKQGETGMTFQRGPLFSSIGWRTKSTALRPRRKARCWRRCRKKR